jgi:shikimate kinase
MAMDYERIWLIGFMGTGKSRVARPLAAALDWQAVDIDTLIEADAHDDIAGIFKSGGEGAFRVLESQAVERVAKMARVVVATGGGTVLAEVNRRAMRERGFIVCLDARPETIAERIRQSPAHVSERPLLAGDDPLTAIIALKEARAPLYRQADIVIETDRLSPDEVTHRVLMAFRERSAVAGGRA